MAFGQTVDRGTEVTVNPVMGGSSRAAALSRRPIYACDPSGPAAGRNRQGYGRDPASYADQTRGGIPQSARQDRGPRRSACRRATGTQAIFRAQAETGTQEACEQSAAQGGRVGCPAATAAPTIPASAGSTRAPPAFWATFRRHRQRAGAATHSHGAGPIRPPPASPRRPEPKEAPTPGLSKRSVILFAPQAADPAESALGAIKFLAGDLNAAMSGPSSRVQLLAYGGNRGDKGSDARRLSLKRALAIRQVLIDDGVSADRIDVRAMGGVDDTGPADRVDVFVKA